MNDPGNLYVRRDVWALSESETWHPVLLAYAQAIRELQTRAVDDPTSWAYQAGIHGSPNPPPAGAVWNQCQHGSWYFLPWHRLYVYYLERIVRAAVVAQGGDPAWALPYWNYEAPGADSIPPAFRQTALPDGSPNPLYVGERAPGINQGGRLPPQVITSRAALAALNFLPPPGAGFGGGEAPPTHFYGAFGLLERTPHNDIHNAVGGPTGWMADPDLAALDPIFWLHHTNIDRLWSVWLAQGGGRADPDQSDWLDQGFVFSDDSGARVTATVLETLDPASLGYTYDSLQEAAVGAGAMAMSASSSGGHEPELVGASDAPLELVGRPARVDVTIDRRAAQEALAGSTEAVPQRVYVNLEDIEAERNPGTVYAVYLTTPGGAGDPEPGTYVGNLSFFGIEHVDEGGDDRPHGVRHTYDVTALVGELRAQGRWDEEGVGVVFQPLGLLPPAGEEALGVDATAAAEAEAAAESAPVRIGRVSVFYE